MPLTISSQYAIHVVGRASRIREPVSRDGTRSPASRGSTSYKCREILAFSTTKSIGVNS